MSQNGIVVVPEGISKRAQNALWLILLGLAAAGWALTILQVRKMGSISHMPEMAMQPVSALLFLPVWIGMMIAMMFPSVAPMVSLFAAVSRGRREAGARGLPTWIFLSGYLTVWILFGIAAFLLSRVVPAVGMAASGLWAVSPLAGGFVLILAGLYQWSPLKGVCLRHCRSPLGFILHEWRDGAGGAFRMGFVHGAYCVGCCWGLMVVLFAMGLMNLGWMVLLSAVIFAEKIVRYGPFVGKLAGVGLVLLGVISLILPLVSRLANIGVM
jgi:predicted metal-binding membrane protein